MAILCLDATLEILRPLCYRGRHRLQRDLCRCFHKGSFQTVQVVVTVSARHVLQNSPQFIVQGVKVWTSWGPILGTEKRWNVLPQPFLSRFGLVGRRWKTNFWPLKRVVLKGFTTPCSTSSWYTWAPVFTPFLQKWGVTPDAPPATKPWHRKDDGRSAPFEPSPSPHRMFEHKSCHSGWCTALRWWRFSHLWRGCFRVHSWRATGGEALCLSVGPPSQWK